MSEIIENIVLDIIGVYGIFIVLSYCSIKTRIVVSMFLIVLLIII